MKAPKPTPMMIGPAEMIFRPKRGTSSGPDMPAASATPSEKGMPVNPALSIE